MSTLKVLIADKFPAEGIQALEQAGCIVNCQPGLADDTLEREIVESACDVLVVRSTRVTAAMIESSNELALIVRAGAGYNTIDVKAASRRSVLVANCPGKNAVAVAELTLGLILALDRRIPDNVADLRNGRWNKKKYTKARGLKRRTLGIVGMGEIGSAVAARAAAFEMDIVAWSRSLTTERAESLGVRYAKSPADVAACADVLTIHLAANEQTHDLIDEHVLSKLKPGSYLINTSRAEVLNHEALARAVAEKNIRVGLDVFPGEPSTGEGEFNDPIADLEGIVYGTHHIGASTDQAQEAIARETVRIITEYKGAGRVINCVNLRAMTPATCGLVVRHRNRPGVLAHTLNAISYSGINVEEMENIICDGAEAACAQILLDARPSDELLDKIRHGNEHVLAVTLTTLSPHAHGAY